MSKLWYAIMLSAADEDWGYGSHSLREAKRMLKAQIGDWPSAFIAVINEAGEWVKTIKYEEEVTVNDSKCQ